MNESQQPPHQGIRFSSRQSNKHNRSYPKQIDPGALAEYICRQFAESGYETQAIDRGSHEAIAQISKKGKMKAFLGLRETLTIRMHVIETGTFIEMGQAAWADKIVGLAGGWFITIVPFFTSPFGIYNNFKLRDKAWTLVEHFVGQ